MQSVSTLYNTLLAAGSPKEVRATIAGTVYGQDKIISATTRASVMGTSAATIGNCVAKELSLVLRNPGDIPRMAQIVLEFRLNDGTQQSEWIPKGTYFIDTRDEDYFGVLSINAYDAMLKGEQSFTQSGNQGTWPRSDIQVVEEIAQRLGVTLDSRTEAILTADNEIQYPGYGDDAYTMREILGFIGSMYSGNWIITDQDTLRLIALGDIPAETNYLVTENGDAILIGGYKILV